MVNSRYSFALFWVNIEMDYGENSRMNTYEQLIRSKPKESKCKIRLPRTEPRFYNDTWKLWEQMKNG